MSKVYFSKDLSSETILKLYKELGVTLEGNVAVKVHSGEAGNQNFLRPEYFKEIMTYVGDKDGSEDWKIKDNDTEKQRGLLYSAFLFFLRTDEYVRADVGRPALHPEKFLP